MNDPLTSIATGLKAADHILTTAVDVATRTLIAIQRHRRRRARARTRSAVVALLRASERAGLGSRELRESMVAVDLAPLEFVLAILELRGAMREVD